MPLSAAALAPTFAPSDWCPQLHQQQWCNILPLRHAADSLPLPLLLLAVYSMPMPRPGQVLGLVGTNGIGKSTALKILAGKLKPNLGRFSSPPDWEEILGYFRGSELQVGRGGEGRGRARQIRG